MSPGTIMTQDKGFEIKSMPMADLINSIKRALVIKQNKMQEFGINIKNVELTIKTVAIADGGTNISLQIPILGKLLLGSKISEKSLQTTTLTLVPSKNVKFEKDIELNSLEETIIQSISSIVEGVKTANKEDSAPMELDDASFTFNFILSEDTRISMIIETGIESELSNTLKINFEKEKKLINL